ncbi:MAG: hypothetical protein K2O06_18230 [Acetatifactor sp.]|nr:hypothetical protein [Acetatifactor sp.]
MAIQLIIQLVILMGGLIVLPVVVGGLFVNAFSGEKRFREPFRGEVVFGLLFQWVSGQLCLWAGFHILCTALILKGENFDAVIKSYGVLVVSLLLLAAAGEIRRGAVYTRPQAHAREHEKKKDWMPVVLWCLAGALLVLQLVLAGVLAYEEGDDAFYVAISTATESSDTMYQTLAYTGRHTSFDARHGLAPFPVWVAMAARITGIRTVTMAQIALPVVLIGMSYAIYYLIGKKLFPQGARQVPMFLIFIECLVLFGGYSTYSAENFLLVRTAQGKAVLASIVIPFLVLLLLQLLEDLQESHKIGRAYWALLALTAGAGCLCSTLGNLLTCLMLAACGLCILVCYRKWKELWLMAGCCMLPLGMIFLYMWIK